MEYQDINEQYQAILAVENLNKAWEVWKDYFVQLDLDDDYDYEDYE